MSDRAEILSALDAIDPAQLTYDEWLHVGMALEAEGLDQQEFDSWSRRDPARYKGERDIDAKWRSFHSDTLGKSDVTGKTIFQMAYARGWKPAPGITAAADFRPAKAAARPTVKNDLLSGGAIPWDSYINDDVVPRDFHQGELSPEDECRIYLQTVFAPDERVRIVTGDTFTKDGKVLPHVGAHTMTAGDLIGRLNAGADLSTATRDNVGAYNPQAGAWIGVNPVDGVLRPDKKAMGNDNVTAFRHVLVEADGMPVDEQERRFRALKLPIAALVSSGGRSIHAVVRVDAANKEEYEARVRFLYQYLQGQGIDLDPNDKNSSRLSRLPGADRGDNHQRLLAVNIGRRSWYDWYNNHLAPQDKLIAATPEEAEKLQQLNKLPPIESLDGLSEETKPELAPELIYGILRRGHKMLISGDSKAGKSFLLINLALSIATGRWWLGHPCLRSRVLYINLEIDGASFKNRVWAVQQALGIPVGAYDGYLDVWTLRGIENSRMDVLEPLIEEAARDRNYGVLIIDPVYKIITGDENSAADMAAFVHQFDRLCASLGVAMVYAHHHTKGSQGMKKSIDRGSGSGVFGRDPDAVLDMSELYLSDDVLAALKSGILDFDSEIGDDGGIPKAFRIESNLREFANIKPINVWFEYPVHKLDTTGLLKDMGIEGSSKASLTKTKNHSVTETRKANLTAAYDALLQPGAEFVKIKDLAKHMNLSAKTVQRYVDEFSDYFQRDGGKAYRLYKQEEGGEDD